MKFMKLGSRSDTFNTAETVRSVASEVPSDLEIEVKGCRYLLHKFPLLSKCGRFQGLSSSKLAEGVIELSDFPSDVEAFEQCAKFCYGITITISARNIIRVRCAAEYLQMSETIEKGNLIYKLDIFLSSCILRGWTDSILTLQSTRAFPKLSQELDIAGKCIGAIASKIICHPAKQTWSYSCSRRGRDEGSFKNAESRNQRAGARGWWAEDIAELGIDHFWTIMVTVKSEGKLPADLVGEALQVYARRWLPGMSKHGTNRDQMSGSCPDGVGEVTSRHRFIMESIVNLLPSEKGSVPCRFLLKLLKMANILGAHSKKELAKRVGIQLEEAAVNDLLIPSLSHASETLYDVDIVMDILEHFLLQGQSPPTSPRRERGRRDMRRRSRSAENVDFNLQESRRSSSVSHNAKFKVAKLIDGYLLEVARDPNLPLLKVTSLAEAIPDFARPDHDDLYRVIDIYLKAHPNLSKDDRKRLCRILDCKKLSVEACIQAAQNEFLPLRVVVQVLFFEQARAGQLHDLPSNLKSYLASQEADDGPRCSDLRDADTAITGDDWSVSALKSSKMKLSSLRMKLAEDDAELQGNSQKRQSDERPPKLKSMYSVPARPKWMMGRLWPTSRSVYERH